MKSFSGKIDTLVLQGGIRLIFCDMKTSETKHQTFRISSKTCVQLHHEGETLKLMSPPGISVSEFGFSITGSFAVVNDQLFVNGKRCVPRTDEEDKTDEKEEENESKEWNITNE